MTTALDSALKLYFGDGTSAYPKENPQAVLAEFGPRLLEQVEALAAGISHLRPDWSKHTLASATEWAESEMKRLHPSLDDGSAKTLGWAFSYWNK